MEGKLAEEGAAACALHSLTDGMPAQQYKSLLCSGTGVLPALVKTLESQSAAVEYATSRALINLAKIPGNQQEIVNALFNQMLVRISLIAQILPCSDFSIILCMQAQFELSYGPASGRTFAAANGHRCIVGSCKLVISEISVLKLDCSHASSANPSMIACNKQGSFRGLLGVLLERHMSPCQATRATVLLGSSVDQLGLM